MFRLYMDAIDYKKLIELQARDAQTRVSPEKSKNLKAYEQKNLNKVKTYKLNSVKRHH